MASAQVCEMGPHVSTAKCEETTVHVAESLSRVTRVRRIFNGTQLYFFALGYMQSWEAVATIIGAVFSNGGPRAMVWGFLPVMVGVLCQVASIAEASSLVPLAGAQYHWCWFFAPPSIRKLLTWIQGWSTTFSWIALLASISNVTANAIVSVAAANNATFDMQQWQIVLIMLACLVAIGLLNLYLFRLIPWVECVAGLLHIMLWVTFIAVLLVLADRHSADFVFFQGSTLSGWNSAAAFNIGNQASSWCFVSFDFISHISEASIHPLSSTIVLTNNAQETRRPGRSVPQAMFWSIVTNALMAFSMVMVFLYTVGDVSRVASSRYPLMDICLQATGSVAGATAMVCGILVILLSGQIGALASVSRLTWAWSRDGAFPGSAFFAYVDPRQRVPLRSVYLATGLVMLLSLLNLASTTAFSIIISISTFGLYQSYIVAITCMLHARLTGRMGTAPWSLGKLGPYVNAIAILYSIWMAVFMVFPTSLPVTGANMNYALPLNAFVWVLGVATWFIWAKRHWNGLDEDVIRNVIEDGKRGLKD